MKHTKCWKKQHKRYGCRANRSKADKPKSETHSTVYQRNPHREHESAPPIPVFRKQHLESPVPRPELQQDTDDIHHWNLKLYHAGTQRIRDTLLAYNHCAAAIIKLQQITCSACHTGKMKRSPHTRIHRIVDRGKRCVQTYVGH